MSPRFFCNPLDLFVLEIHCSFHLFEYKLCESSVEDVIVAQSRVKKYAIAFVSISEDL